MDRKGLSNCEPKENLYTGLYQTRSCRGKQGSKSSAAGLSKQKDGIERLQGAQQPCIPPVSSVASTGNFLEEYLIERKPFEEL